MCAGDLHIERGTRDLPAAHSEVCWRTGEKAGALYVRITATGTGSRTRRSSVTVVGPLVEVRQRTLGPGSSVRVICSTGAIADRVLLPSP